MKSGILKSGEDTANQSIDGNFFTQQSLNSTLFDMQKDKAESPEKPACKFSITKILAAKAVIPAPDVLSQSNLTQFDNQTQSIPIQRIKGTGSSNIYQRLFSASSLAVE
jgi:hypothetical protein